MASDCRKRRLPEVVVFENRPFRKDVLQNKEPTTAAKDSPESEMPRAAAKNFPESEVPQMEFDMKKARYDVLRFGMKGFDKEKQKKDKISMAIKLGAKPPKKEYKNYKEIIAEKKMKKEQDVADKLLRQYCIEILKQKKKTRHSKKMKKKKKIE